MRSSSNALDRTKATLFLEQDISKIKGVSSARASIFNKMGISTVRDLLTHYPRRYIDLSNVATIADAKIGGTSTIFCEIYEIKQKYPRKNLPITEITLVDGTQLLIVSVFHQPWLAKKLKAGMKIAVAGKVTFHYGFKRMTNPFIEEVGNLNVAGKILSIHPATEKLTAAKIRSFIKSALYESQGCFDYLNIELRKKRELAPRSQALQMIHFPKDEECIKKSHRRLAYDEVLLLQLFLKKQQLLLDLDKTPHVHVKEDARINEVIANLPFELTQDQKIATDELFEHMESDSIANHMILGDVGTGKTAVAALGVVKSALSGFQSMVLAPTEVLADQHYKTFSSLLEGADISIGLLTGSTPSSKRAVLLEEFRAGRIDCLIGTHALLEPDVVPKDLSFVVIDEQQRFGVDQRSSLLAKGDGVDALYLTATPIPRSLALTLFGNLTLSFLRQKPHDVTQRTTKVLTRQEKGKAYDKALECLKCGQQVFVVCPLIGTPRANSDKNQKDSADLEGIEVDIEDMAAFSDDDPVAAIKEASFLQDKVFVDYKVGLLHGALSSEEKAQVMSDFANGFIDVLVTTTVIEVGVDIPNASVMIIEDADRFGLSQLHQLRGRVGRGGMPSFVFMISSTKREDALKRLSYLEKTDDGFRIAEYDLNMRREGDLLGNRQSGTTALKIVDIIEDKELIELASIDADEILEEDPMLKLPKNQALARELRIIFSSETQVSGG